MPETLLKIALAHDQLEKKYGLLATRYALATGICPECGRGLSGTYGDDGSYCCLKCGWTINIVASSKVSGAYEVRPPTTGGLPTKRNAPIRCSGLY